MTPEITKANLEDIPELTESVSLPNGIGNTPKIGSSDGKKIKNQAQFLRNGEVYKIGLPDSIFGFCVILKNENNFVIEHLWVLSGFIERATANYYYPNPLKEP